MGRPYPHKLTPLAKLTSGYTLIELVVVAGIIAILTIILIVGHGSFNRTLILSNTASDISLLIRNAQIFGIGSRTYGQYTNAGYGIDVSTASQTRITFFADTDPMVVDSRPDHQPGNGYYTGADSQFTQYVDITNGMKISNFCAITDEPVSYCKSGGTIPTEHVSIVFTRPNTSAIIAAGSIGQGQTTHGVGNGAPPFTRACMTISSPEGATRIVRVTKLGQVSVDAPMPVTTCP